MKLQNILRMAVPVVLVMCSTLQIAQADEIYGTQNKNNYY